MLRQPASSALLSHPAKWHHQLQDLCVSGHWVIKQKCHKHVRTWFGLSVREDQIIFVESDYSLGIYTSGKGPLHCNNISTGKYQFQYSESLKTPETDKDLNRWDVTITLQLARWWGTVCSDGKTQLRLYAVLCWTTVKIRSRSFHRKWQQQDENHGNKQYDSPTRYFLITPKNAHICSMFQKC